MSERRKALRSRSLLGGMIAFNRRSSTMDCQVRNISADGAKLSFCNTATVPDRFEVTIGQRERSYEARIIWRRPEEAGVQFLAECQQAVAVPLVWARRLRRCEDEKARLRRRIAELTDSPIA
ncbi:MAG TPA: PilZ domain-containing protein [Pseudolabrys sp.]|nr:PilZ domain-containing protein [Pseudolabrys sp.]